MSTELSGLIHRTEAYVQEETLVQRRILALLDEQERATVENDTEALFASTQHIDEELAGQGARSKRRAELIAAFARHWGVPAGALTLGSIVERAGPAAQNLGRMRRELREVTQRVSESGRRLAALARLHRGVFGELIRILVGQEAYDDESAGQLLRLEA